MTWNEIVRDVLHDARRIAGGGAPLAESLRLAGVGPGTGAYSESAVSNWINGRTMPPADVFLAAASLTRSSLDERLGVASTRVFEEPAPAGDDIAHLRADMERLESLVLSRLAATASGSAYGTTKDVTAVFATRTEANERLPMIRLLAAAQHVDILGLSLNGLCQEVSDLTLAELIENGLSLRCLFLDPDSAHTAIREAEEGHPNGYIATVTRTNMHALQRVRDRLSPQAADRLQIRTYDQPVRVNLTLVDGLTALVQIYLHGTRGLDSPALLIEGRDDEPHGLFPVFNDTFDAAWKQTQP